MARRSTRRYPTTRRPRRRLEWARYSFTQDVELANNSTTPWINLLSEFEQVLGADAAGTTVTRIRGWVLPFLNTDQSPDALFTSSFGIQVMTDPPAGLTNTQRVEQLSQAYADWMYYEHFPVISQFGPNLDVLNTQKVDIDIKSMRRFDELQQSLYCIAGIPGGPASGTFSLRGHLNILLKMP